MEEENAPKPQKVKAGTPSSKETWYFSSLLQITILSLVVIDIFLNVFVPEGPQNFDPPPKKFKRTEIAHVDAQYSKWALSDDFLQELWDFVQNSPINPVTDKHQLMFTVINQGQVEFSENWFCSLKRTDLKENSYVIIALDQESYTTLKSFNAPVIYLSSNFTKNSVNNQKIVDFYDIVKVRPTILHQLLMWDCEVVLSDSDIVFFSDPFKLFKGSAEIEAQCDSKVFFDYEPFNKNKDLTWSVNLGFYKVKPTQGMLSLMKEWLPRCYITPKLVDQTALKKILTNGGIASNDGDGIVSNHKEHGKIKIRILDPMLAVNAGGIYLDGKEKTKELSIKRKIKVPVLCHFFHLGRVSEKKKLMVDNNQWLIKDGKCTKPHGNPFPAWND